MDDEVIDEATEEIPTGPLVGALLGLGLVVVGLGWLALAIVGLAGSLGLPLLLAVAGFVAFVASMLQWDPRF